MITKALIRLANEYHGLHDAFFERQSRDRGATAVEYALIVSLIAVAIVAIVATLGGTISNIFNDTNTQITNRNPAAPAAP